jgi:GH15 family glucan-1,4-alpha-glucosidase
VRKLNCVTEGNKLAGIMASKISDHAVIGDCETAALVGCHGSIDWLCWPRFDSPACFVALIGSPANGHWLVCPVASVRVSRRYRPHCGRINYP